MRTKTTERNREILAAYQAGQLPIAIAEKYGLALVTVDQIIRTEKHKRALSADEFYRTRRRSSEPQS